MPKEGDLLSRLTLDAKLVGLTAFVAGCANSLLHSSDFRNLGLELKNSLLAASSRKTSREWEAPNLSHSVLRSAGIGGLICHYLLRLERKTFPQVRCVPHTIS